MRRRYVPHGQDPPAEADEQVRAILGDPLELVIGTGKKARTSPLARIRATAEERPGGFVVGQRQATAAVAVASFLTPILTFVAAADSNPQIKAALDAVKEYAGSDTISLTATPIKNGCAVRLEVQEGVLKAIGGAVKGAGRR